MCQGPYQHQSDQDRKSESGPSSLCTVIQNHRQKQWGQGWGQNRVTRVLMTFKEKKNIYIHIYRVYYVSNCHCNFVCLQTNCDQSPRSTVGLWLSGLSHRTKQTITVCGCELFFLRCITMPEYSLRDTHIHIHIHTLGIMK